LVKERETLHSIGAYKWVKQIKSDYVDWGIGGGGKQRLGLHKLQKVSRGGDGGVKKGKGTCGPA